MKKKCVLTFLVAVNSCLFLSSCYFMNPNYNWGNYHPSSNQGNKDKVDFKTPSYDSSFKKENMTKDSLGAGFGYHYLPSIGNSKILVVPVEVSGDTFEKRYGSDWKTALQNVFFGDSTNTGWESVSSFYEKSSYSKLHLSGEVSPVIRLNKNASELKALNTKYSNNNKNYTDEILKEVCNTLAENDAVDFSEYDTDGDGYLDAVWLVYSTPYDQGSDLFWAFTTWASLTGDVDGVTPCCYAWASYKFLMEQDYRPLGTTSYKNSADAHTFIHETGHMMGLDDYYSYDYDYASTNPRGNADTPVGGNDMMDFNIGDHDSFSKYVLGWLNPVVVTKEMLDVNNTLSLQSLQESGKALLIPIYKDGSMDYNQTPFDEYLIVEYYTPTGLNAKDVSGYGLSKQRMYSQKGVLVYHVDARVGKMIASGNNSIDWDGYCYDMLPKYGEDRNWGRSYSYCMIYSNTRSYSWDQSLNDTGKNFYRGRLISLLPATGKKIEGAKTGYSSDRSLFRVGTTFSSSIYSDFVFDDGSENTIGFKVKEVSDTDCKLEFIDF